ncbi:MAG TPA: hypothetical protein VF267_06635 [Gammaproteobacteria bacterium]
MNTRSFVRLAALLTSFAFLTACGGGGGGGGNNPPPPPPSDNQAPTVTIAAIDPVMELSAVMLTASGEDVDDDDLAFTWTQTAGTAVEIAGADAAELTFEAPKVKDSETLQFEVSVDDGNGGTDTAAVEVLVNEANGIVYSAVEEHVGMEEIYIHHPSLDKPLKLHADLGAPEVEGTRSEIGDLLILPDHRRIVYVRTTDVPGGGRNSRVRVATLDGFSDRDITGTVFAPIPESDGAQIEMIALSPDGTRLAFVGDLEADNVRELFVVPVDSLDGGDRTKVSGEIPSERLESDFPPMIRSDFVSWSPDSGKIAFAGDLLTENHTEVFVADLESGQRTVISRTPSFNNGSYLNRVDENYGAFLWSPDGEFITTVENDAEGIYLNIVRPDGTDRRTLATGLPSGTDEPQIKMRWSSSGRLAFTALTEPVGENRARELYIYTPAAENPGPFAVGGASAIDINPANGLPDAQAATFDWSPDGNHLAFTIIQFAPFRTGIFTVAANATDTAGRQRVDGQTDADAVLGGLSSVEYANWLPDSSRLVFTRNPDGGWHAYSNTPDGTDLDTHNSLPGVNDIIAGVGGALLMEMDDEENGDSVRMATIGTPGDRLVSGSNTASDGDPANGAIDGDVRVSSAGISPDGTLLALFGDPETDGLYQFYVVPMNTVDGGDRQRVSNVLEAAAGEEVSLGYARWVGPVAQ